MNADSDGKKINFRTLCCKIILYSAAVMAQFNTTYEV